MAPARKHTLENKRVKVTMACTVCRKKKVKCNGIQPTCGRCHAMGIVCDYTSQFKKRGPPKSCVEIINSRARRIESLMLLNQQQQQHTKARTLAPEIYKSTATTTPHDHDGDNIFNPVFRIVTDIKVLQSNRSGSFGANPTLSNEDIDKIVTSDQELAWVNAVLKYFNVIFPILFKHHFLDQLIDRRHTTMDPALRYAVYSLGACYQQDQARQLLFEKAIDLLFTSMPLQTPSQRTRLRLSTAQALVIMCWCAFLLGEMDLCRKLRHRLGPLKLEKPATLIDEELHNRTAWVAYVIDQWLYLATNERGPTTELPTNYRLPRLEDYQLLAIDTRQQQQQTGNCSSSTDINMAESDASIAADRALQITAFAETVRLADILRKDPTDRNSLIQWLIELPPYLEIGNGTSSISRMLHIFYQTIVLVHHKDTMAMHTLLSIVEQTQVPLLYNVFGVALTHTVNHCLRTKDQAHLDKSLHILNTANPTLLPLGQLEQLLEEKLVHPTGLVYNSGLQVFVTMEQQQQQEQQQALEEEHEGDDNSNKHQESVLVSEEDAVVLVSVPEQPIIPQSSSPPSPPQLDLASLLQPPGDSSDMFAPWDTAMLLSPIGSPIITTHHLTSPSLTMAATPAESFGSSPTSYFLNSPSNMPPIPLLKEESPTTALASETDGLFSISPLLQ